MDAMKCDRCGAYYERYGSSTQANTLYIQNKDYIGKQKCDKKYDLCPCCLSAVQEWLKNKNGDVNDDKA